MKITTEDRLFSIYIRSRDDWTCKRCGRKYNEKSTGLHCSHFYGRRALSTRYDPENADAHCCGCHRYFEANPNEFRDWKFNQLGKEKYWKLRERWQQKGKKKNTKEFRAYLREQIRDIGYGHLI